MPRMFIRSDRIFVGGAGVLFLLGGIGHYAGWGSVLTFLLCAGAICLLASLVGRSVEQLGDRFGAGATGVLQSALGNLPELFICIFSLQAGLVQVVQAALVGSILANLLLVLGLAFVVGGLKHGTQQLGSERARTIVVLMLLSVTAWTIPSLAHFVHTPASEHEVTFSVIVSVVLLALFALSLPFALRRDTGEAEGAEKMEHEAPRWPVWLAVAMLAVAGAMAAFVSDWFVAALQPSMDSLGISEAFAGLVIVAIAGNAVENVVGIQLALKNQADFALSVILQSPLQISLVVAPALVLLSPLVGASFTLVLPPLLIAVLIMAVVLTVLVVLDGESNWLEGATLIVLYAIIATAFWWG